MIILDSTLKSLEIILPGAITTNQLPFTAGYIDNPVAAPLIESDGQTNGGTAVTMVAAPGVGTQRMVKHLTVVNADTVQQKVTIRINNNGTFRNLFVATLNVGDNLVYAEGGWRLLDSTGAFRGVFNVAQWGGTVTTLGQKTMAASVPVVIASDQTTIPVTTNDTVKSGSLSASFATQVFDVPLNGDSMIAYDISGTWVGQLNFLGSINGTNFFPIDVIYSFDRKTNAQGLTNVTSNGQYFYSTVGLKTARVEFDIYTSGTANIAALASVSGTDFGPNEAILVGRFGNTRQLVRVGTGTGTVYGHLDDGEDITEGITTDVAITTDINGTISGKLRGLVKIFGSVWDSVNNLLNINLARWGGTATSLGQKTMAASVPVVIASDQTIAVKTTRFDYDIRVDGNPVYIGTAAPGASDTSVTSTDWAISKFAYDATSRPINIKVATGVAWANRTTVTYQ